MEIKQPTSKYPRGQRLLPKRNLKTNIFKWMRTKHITYGIQLSSVYKDIYTIKLLFEESGK